MFSKTKRLLAIFIVMLLAIITTACATKQDAPAEKNASKVADITDIVDPESEWEKVASGKGFIEGLNFDKNGDMWLVSPITNALLKVEDGVAVQVGEDYGNPNGSKFHEDGRLFVADQTGVLYAFDPETEEREIIADSYNGEPLRALNDLVFDAYGGLYVTEPDKSNVLDPNGRVFYLPPGEDSELELFAENIAYPNGIAVSADGQRVYIAEFDQNRVISVPSATAEESPETPFVFARFEGGIGPDGLAVDQEGNLYVAHFQAGKVSVVDKNGIHLGAIPLPESAGSFVTNLAFHDGYLYVTESLNNEVWRIKVNQEGLQPFNEK